MADIKNIVKKLAKLLHKDGSVYNGSVCFDFNSYDMEEDIPFLLDNDGNKILIEDVHFQKNGSKIVVTTDLGEEFTLSMNDFTEEELDKMNMYELLSNVYYETKDSYEIGDFELDFLKQR